MQITLDVVSVQGISSALQYLRASEKYLNEETYGLDFSFPDIANSCPVCHRSGCAQWKGYYTRSMHDLKLGYFEEITIRYGRCQSSKKQFSFLPDFLIPFRRLTKSAVGAIMETWKKHRQMSRVLDEVVAKHSKFIPLSSAYSAIDHLSGLLRINGVDQRHQRTIQSTLSFVTEFPHEVQLKDWVSDRNWIWHAPVLRIRQSLRSKRALSRVESRKIWNLFYENGVFAAS